MAASNGSVKGAEDAKNEGKEPTPLPIEDDLMALARLGELRAIQKLFDSGKYNASSADEQGITALHVRSTKHSMNDQSLTLGSSGQRSMDTTLSATSSSKQALR